MVGIFPLLKSPEIQQENGQMLQMVNAGIDVTRTTSLPLHFHFSSVAFSSPRAGHVEKEEKRSLCCPILCKWIEVFFSVKVLIRGLVFWAPSPHLCS